MQNVPGPAISVNQISRRTHALRLLKQGGLSAAAVLAIIATTGAAVGPDASRIDLMMYSFGSVLAVVMIVKIAIKLFVYLVKTAVVLGVLGMIYILARIAIEAVGS